MFMKGNRSDVLYAGAATGGVLRKKVFLKISQETPIQVFFCEICEIFKNIYFKEHLLTTASVLLSNCSRKIDETPVIVK